MIACVTRVIDILRSAGVTAAPLRTVHIDADEHEVLSLEMTDRHETRTPALWIIAGNHEDLGKTVLRRESGVFTVSAEEVSFVRGFGNS